MKSAAWMNNHMRDKQDMFSVPLSIANEQVDKSQEKAQSWIGPQSANRPKTRLARVAVEHCCTYGYIKNYSAYHLYAKEL